MSAGMTVLPVRSTRVAPGGTFASPSTPTQANRPPSTMNAAFSIAGRPSPTMRRAPENTVPLACAGACAPADADHEETATVATSSRIARERMRIAFNERIGPPSVFWRAILLSKPAGPHRGTRPTREMRSLRRTRPTPEIRIAEQLAALMAEYRRHDAAHDSPRFPRPALGAAGCRARRAVRVRAAEDACASDPGDGRDAADCRLRLEQGCRGNREERRRAAAAGIASAGGAGRQGRRYMAAQRGERRALRHRDQRG